LLAASRRTLKKPCNGGGSQEAMHRAMQINPDANSAAIHLRRLFAPLGLIKQEVTK